jgi:hypothetical protein
MDETRHVNLRAQERDELVDEINKWKYLAKQREHALMACENPKGAAWGVDHLRVLTATRPINALTGFGMPWPH